MELNFTKRCMKLLSMMASKKYDSNLQYDCLSNLEALICQGPFPI